MKGSWSNLLKINFVHLKSCLKNPGSQNSASKQVLKEGGNKELEKNQKKNKQTHLQQKTSLKSYAMKEQCLIR